MKRSSGDARYALLRAHLSSCFTTSDAPFSTDFDVFNIQLSDIYRVHYSAQHEKIWEQYLNYFTLNDVTNAIDKLDCAKDAGPMMISAKFVVFNRDKLAPILLDIFNSILHTGNFPVEWKKAFLTPIPKKGNLADVTNYRGIAMQSVIPKLFDMLITEKIYGHVASIIPQQQHGFVKNRSTTSNLLEITQYSYTSKPEV